MRRINRPQICLAVLMLTVAAAQAATIEVDCNSGGDLGALLNRLAKAHPAGLVPGENTEDPAYAVTIKLSGTCVGNFVIASSGVKLEGVGPRPDAAVLQGAAPINSVTPVVEVRGVRGTFFENLTVTGGSTGIHVRHSDALIIGCEFYGNGNGVLSQASETFIGNSHFSGNTNGVQSVLADHVSINNTLLVDNEQYGAVIVNGSDLVVDGGEIRGNLVGIRAVNNSRAFLRAPLIVGDTTGGSHIQAVNKSMVTINSGVTVTGGKNIEIVNDSLLESSDATLDANLVLYQSGKAFLKDTVVGGGVTLIRFSNALLNADIAGPVTCDGTSDADCEGGSIAASDCSSCVVLRLATD